LRLLHTEDETQEIATQPDNLDTQSVAAAAQLQSGRPNLNFAEMSIPIGSTLRSTRDDSSVIVIGPKKVRWGADEMSLTAATRKMLGIEYDVRPGAFWSFDGKTIAELYDETYNDEG
jgi:hypothetical protein